MEVSGKFEGARAVYVYDYVYGQIENRVFPREAT
jgi:hypothetical protein